MIHRQFPPFQNLGRTFFATAMAIIVTLGAASQATARIGETKEQLVERYGEPTKEPAPMLAASEGAAVFVKDGNVEVTAEFKRGKVWLISYRSSSVHMKTAVEDELRDANDGLSSGLGDWKDTYKHLGRTYWVTADKSIYAVSFETGVHKVYRFFTVECKDELESERKQRVKEALPGTVTTTEEPEEKDEEKKTGF